MAENKYPADEFDELAAARRTSGAHHRARSNARWWVALFLVVILAPLLGWGVVNAIGYHESKKADATPPAVVVPTETMLPEEPTAGETASTEATPTIEATPETVEPTEEATPELPPVDYGMAVQVLNATSISGFAASNQQKLETAGFTNTQTGNYRYERPNVSKVWYPSAESESTALAVADALGIDHANLTLDANATGGNVIVVVLARDL